MSTKNITLEHQKVWHQFSNLLFRQLHPDIGTMESRLGFFNVEAREVFGVNSSELIKKEEKLQDLFWGLYYYHVDVEPFVDLIKSARVSASPNSDIKKHNYESLRVFGGLIEGLYDVDGDQKVEFLVETASKLKAIKTVQKLFKKPDFVLPPELEWIGALPKDGITKLIEDAGDFEKNLNRFDEFFDTCVYEPRESISDIQANIDRIQKSAGQRGGLFNPDSFQKYVDYIASDGKEDDEDEEEKVELDAFSIVDDDEEDFFFDRLAIITDESIADQQEWIERYYKNLKEDIKGGDKEKKVITCEEADLEYYEKKEAEKCEKEAKKDRKRNKVEDSISEAETDSDNDEDVSEGDSSDEEEPKAPKTKKQKLSPKL